MASFADRRKFRGSSYRYPKTKSLGTNKEAIETKKKNANNLNENKSGGNNKERHFSHPTVMGYPVARGAKEHTGDTLLIKCFEYKPPKTTTSYEYTLSQAEKKGKIGDKNYNENDLILSNSGDIATSIAPKSFKMVNDGASDKLQNEKYLYYVELPIPQDVNDSNTVTWGDDSLNILQLAGLAVAQKALTQDPRQTFDEAKNLLTKGIFEQAKNMDPGTKQGIIAAATGKAIDSLGGNISINSAVGRATGKALNQNLELLFDSVNLRTFPFSINFSPRTPDESMMVKHIIRAFKSSMAAKKGTSEVGQGGIFLSAPDVFHLRYLHRGKDHPFLNSFKHCALTGMTVNYTNAGTYASYEDGTPVSINMNLTFKELNPIYFEDYDEFEKGDNNGVGF